MSEPVRLLTPEQVEAITDGFVRAVEEARAAVVVFAEVWNRVTRGLVELPPYPTEDD